MGWLNVAIAIGLIGGFSAGLAQPANAAPGDLAFGKVIVDSNKNDAIDSGPVGTNDTPLAGVKVTLKGSDPTHAGWETTTAADGSWSFSASDDYSASPGPFTVTIDAAGVNNNAYITPVATSADNDFTRVAGNGNAQKSESASIPAGTTDLELNALVYPTWSTDVIALNDPAGYDGKAIYTGTGPFNSDDEPGNDSGNGNDIVRNGDVVNYNWSVASKAELDTSSTFNGWFEQTLTPKDGAVVTFGEIPTACAAGTSTITALPSGDVLKPRVAPPAGTTSVVLKCDLGTISQDTAQKTVATQAFVTSASPHGSSFDTSVRTYGATAEGVTTARPDGPEDFGPFKITAVPRYDLEKQRPWVWALGQKNVNGVNKFGWEIMYSVQISTDRKVGVEAFE